MNRLCGTCKKSFAAEKMIWVYDRYSIPYKFVCRNCEVETQKQIDGWSFNSLDAGEHLEEEDY